MKNGRSGRSSDSAVDLSAALSPERPDLPFFIFGHTHRARLKPICGRPAWYVNPGTWSNTIRGSGPDATDSTLFPFVRLTEFDGAVTACIEYWKARENPTTDSTVAAALLKRATRDHPTA